MKKRCYCTCLLFTVLLVVLAYPAGAAQYTVGDRPLNLMGYITQGGQFGMHDGYFAEKGFQSAIMNIFIEAQYQFTDKFTFYGSGLYTMDWMYDLKHDDRSWNDKLFSESRRYQYMDDQDWQLIKELHVTYNTGLGDGSVMLRLGKQIVSWGEMDAIRIMDQINPTDDSRGPADVEFETTIIPIWLARLAYNKSLDNTLLQEFGLEFVLNPDAEFIPAKRLRPGNDVAGIWAPEVTIPLGEPYPMDYAYLGHQNEFLDRPSTWSSDYFEYALRMKLLMKDWLLTLNGFYGRNNYPAFKGRDPFTDFGMAYDGRLIIDPVVEGFYPRQKFVGMTINRDIPFLRFSPIGGITPVFRLESIYSFDSTFTTSLNEFEEFDEFRFGFGLDWKVKFRFIPQSAAFSISPQVFYSHVFDYPEEETLSTVAGLRKEDSLNWTLALSTLYFNAKLVPAIFWWHDADFHSDFLQFKATYDYTNNWRITAGANLFNGSQHDANGFDAFNSKDQIFFKVSYKWG
jgi:hypothetical protein